MKYRDVVAMAALRSAAGKVFTWSGAECPYLKKRGGLETNLALYDKKGDGSA
jgi:hypothetical protein